MWVLSSPSVALLEFCQLPNIYFTPTRHIVFCVNQPGWIVFVNTNPDSGNKTLRHVFPCSFYSEEGKQTGTVSQKSTHNGVRQYSILMYLTHLFSLSVEIGPIWEQTFIVLALKFWRVFHHQIYLLYNYVFQGVCVSPVTVFSSSMALFLNGRQKI